MWRTSILALLAMGGSAQAGFIFSQTSSTVPGIPHFRVVNLFVTNDGVGGTGMDIQAMEVHFTTAATVWSYLTDEADNAEADLVGRSALRWASWVRLRPGPSDTIVLPQPSATDPQWTEGMTSFSVTMATYRPAQTHTRQFARLVFANPPPTGSIWGRVGGSSGQPVAFGSYSAGAQTASMAPPPPFEIMIDKPVKVMHLPYANRPTQFGPVTVESISNLTGVDPQPITIESISPNLLNNIDWITDEPARKVFRLVNLTSEDWRVSTIFFSVPDGVGGLDRQAFTLIMPEPATLGVLGLAIGWGMQRTRWS